MIDLGQLASDTSALVALLALPFLAFGAIFLLAYDRELGGDLFGFGKRTFLLLTMAAVVGWIANVPIFVWNHSIMAVNIGGALLPIAISLAALSGRILPGGPRELTTVLLSLALGIMGLLFVIVFAPAEVGPLVFLAAFGGAILLGLFLRRELLHDHRSTGTATAVVLALIGLGAWGTYQATQVVIGLGIESQFPAYLVVPLVLGAASVPLRWPRRDGPALAYATTTLGVLLGADVLHQPGLFAGPAFLGAIGGAGPLDLVFLSGPFALGIALGIDVLMRSTLRTAPSPAPGAVTDAASAPLDLRFTDALHDYAAQVYAPVPGKVVQVVDASLTEARTALGIGATAPPDRSFEGLSAHPLLASDLANLRSLAAGGTPSRDDARRALVTGFLLQRGLLDLVARRFASTKDRVGAYGIDLLLTFVPAAPLLFLVLLLGHFPNATVASESISYNGAIAALGAWPYVLFVLSEALWGATPGKRILGLQVVGSHGERPPFLALLTRNLPKVVPLFVLSLTVGLAILEVGMPPYTLDAGITAILLVLAGVAGVLVVGMFSVWGMRSSPRRQRLGDTAAGTMVWNRVAPVTPDWAAAGIPIPGGPLFPPPTP